MCCGPIHPAPTGLRPRGVFQNRRQRACGGTCRGRVSQSWSRFWGFAHIEWAVQIGLDCPRGVTYDDHRTRRGPPGAQAIALTSQVYTGLHPERVAKLIVEDVGPERPEDISKGFAERAQRERRISDLTICDW